MAQITLKTPTGANAGSVELDDATFGIQPNVPVMHQVVTAQLANRRAGTQSTKTRSEVRGGGAKPYRQKGTGNARQGSTSSPHYTGGGIALGPKPRSYAQRTPKKMIKLALRSALSDRASVGKVVVVDRWGFDTPKTRDARRALAALGVDGRSLVVVDRLDGHVALSFRNLPDVQVIKAGELNAYDVLCNDWIVFEESLLPTAEGATGTPATDTPVEETDGSLEHGEAEPSSEGSAATSEHEQPSSEGSAATAEVDDTPSVETDGSTEGDVPESEDDNS
jgi:large subunit ribosomal protein L4